MTFDFRQLSSHGQSARFPLRSLLMGLMLAALLVSACQPIQPPAPDTTLSEPAGLRADAPPFAVHGPFWVGYRSLVADEATGDALDVHLWYPALNPAGEREEVQYAIQNKDVTWTPQTPPTVNGRALRNAGFDASQAPYPLVVLSHGFTLSGPSYNTLAEHYASYGFIVLAPEHQEQFDPTFGDMWKALIDRPGDVTQTLDFAEALTAPGGEMAGGVMAGMIDMENVAVVGHSYGGYTALAAAGAQYDMAAYKARCAELSEDDPLAFFCMPVLPFEADMAGRAGLDGIPEGLWPSFGDPRVTAIVPMAGDSYLFDQAGLSQITVPMMVMAGGADTGTPLDWGPKPAYDYAASSQKAMVTLVGAEHMIYSTPCENQPWMDEHPMAGYFCLDPVWDKARALDLIHHLSTAFLLDTLKGDPAAHAALLPDAVQFAGIEYTATLQ